ncbi:hypothetical protein FB192DRAFT_1081341 [Mucor lusitanicus]|uniref:NAD(P)-binding domain-containing protein n=2 Tax=Mucor circinelloides f. lusitanicus TaxID=29924 RepID=A0A168Q134_MUCCL|nr:hypothetical protein FB192DRAFT_1081341 [Mucor lusitanicus]OAD08535.1 hypothetical protein MUCCIDRAFT_105505 [Mucor lusitanicus CBS 277.49]
MTVSSILITGGTSLVAAALVRQTHSQSNARPIVALSRSALPEASAARVHYVRGSVFDADCLSSVLRGNPNVVHTVGAFLDDNSDSADTAYERINCDSSIVVACGMAEKFDVNSDLPHQRKALVYFSVAAGFPGFIFDPDFVHSKREAEAALLGIEFRNRIRVVIFRPGLIYSFHQRFSVLPFAVGLYVIGFLMRPLRGYIPRQLHFLTDLPLQDDDIANAVFEAVDNKAVEGVCDGDRIRLLAKAWEMKRTRADLVLQG